MGLSPSDATAIGAFFVMLTAIVQAVLNQRAADKARKHELDLKRLELEEEHEKEKEPEPVPAPVAHILVVDDDMDHRAVMLLHLAHAGYFASGAASGIEALAIIAKAQRLRRPFDLVLLDQSMPGMSGDVVANYIRAGNGFVKIVFITAHARRQGGRPDGAVVIDGRTAAELGALAIWKKPLDFEALPAMVEEILND